MVRWGPGRANERSASTNASEIIRQAQYEDWYWWYRARLRIIQRLLRYVLPHTDNLILDVGCGSGSTSLGLQRFGRVVAVDLSPEAVSIARGRGLDVVRMDASRLGIPDAMFDVVVALDVIEHIEDDAAAVAELQRVLKPGGVLLVTVPAYKWLWSSHDVAVSHRRRYGRGELRRLLRNGGYGIELCTYMMMTMLAPAAAYRLIEHLPGRHVERTEAHVRFTPVPRPINWLLAHVAAWGSVFAPWISLPFGLSVVAVARRPVPSEAAPASDRAALSA